MEDLIIKTPDDIYEWQCEYNDGKVIKQYNDGKETPFNTLDLKKIKYFALIVRDREKHPDLRDIIVKLDENKKVIYWKKVVGNIGINNISNFQFIIYKIGFEEKIRGRTRKTMLFVYPNGTIEMSGDNEPSLLDDYINALLKSINL